MSAAFVILPRVWAMVEASGGAGFAGQRKGPHALRLVTSEAQGPPLALKVPIPEVAFYRKYTEAMLHRYMKMSLEAGRVPSLMGRELFQGNVSHCKVTGFDDVVLFVHDFGNCIKKLSPGQQHLLRRIGLQGYSNGETAAMLGISLRTVTRRYAEALDRLTGILLDYKMLEPMNESRSRPENSDGPDSCQGRSQKNKMQTYDYKAIIV
jgi:hypothetical protein